ncbi:MAG TPA: hypothetical protein VFU99_00400 [Gaiellaceae bacterium]|nr:hypothetical protein [Gaiellaceae bacterium]
MRKLVKIALVILGIRAFLRWRKRRREAEAVAPAVAPADDPADELRRKLAESREDDAEGQTPEEPAASVADRRTEVHDQARAALDEMTSSDES